MTINVRNAVLGITLLFSGFVRAQTSKVYSTPDYSISYPETWRLDTSKSVFNAILILSPLDSAQDKFDENVNIMEQHLGGQKMDLKGYKELSEGQLAAMGAGTKVLKSEIEKTTGGEQYYCETLMTSSGNALHIKSICRIKNGIAYLVTLTTRTDTFDHYNAIGSPVLESFKLH